jgi:hypothetical protein
MDVSNLIFCPFGLSGTIDNGIHDQELDQTVITRFQLDYDYDCDYHNS